MSYRVRVTAEPGFVPHGASLGFAITDQFDNPDNVPWTGFQWYVSRNGVNLNYQQLNALTEGQVLHTWNRHHFGFKLRGDVDGQFTISVVGNGLNKSFVYTVAERPSGEVPGPRPLTEEDVRRVIREELAFARATGVFA